MRPEMRVLFMSGYTDDAIVRHGVLERGHRVSLQAVHARTRSPLKVREVLDGASCRRWRRPRRPRPVIGRARRERHLAPTRSLTFRASHPRRSVAKVGLDGHDRGAKVVAARCATRAWT